MKLLVTIRYKGEFQLVYIPKKMTTNKLRDCLIEDMKMLQDGRWEPEPNDDSIEAHIDLIEELARRVK